MSNISTISETINKKSESRTSLNLLSFSSEQTDSLTDIPVNVEKDNLKKTKRDLNKTNDDRTYEEQTWN